MIFDEILVCHGRPAYLNAHAKVKKWISGVQLPENRVEFGIIANDFCSPEIIDSYSIVILNSNMYPNDIISNSKSYTSA